LVSIKNLFETKPKITCKLFFAKEYKEGIKAKKIINEIQLKEPTQLDGSKEENKLTIMLNLNY